MEEVEIIDYSPAYKDDIKRLNVEWLEKFFSVEPIDIKLLSDPEGEIINKGGLIFYAKRNEEILGTATLLYIDQDSYELSKMAVTPKAQGLGIGNKLMDHCIEVARKNNRSKLILFSNTKLQPAILLYRKYGFVETPLSESNYKRSNIKMELNLI